MKNAIKYYYNLEPLEIHQVNKTYKFHISNKKYMLYPYDKTIDQLKEIEKLYFSLNQQGIYCHEIIPNQNQEYITNINNQIYVLLNIKIENRKINLNDINFFANLNINVEEYNKIKRTNWEVLWMNNMDYIEYQISQFGKKYPIIRESSDYYIGIVENCISIITNNNLKVKAYSIVHNRINESTTTDEFYNPMNFIIDSRVRDMSEYIKKCLESPINIYNVLQSTIYNNNLTTEEIILLFVRIMYPSTYFDEYERIINNNQSEDQLKKIVGNNNNYEMSLKKVYQYLEMIINMPPIEWLKKT